MSRALPLILLALLFVPAAARADDFVPSVQSCVASAAVNGCAAVPEIDGVLHLAISPDGRSAYAASPGSDSLQVFDRDPASGRLTAKACVNDTGSGGCVNGRAMDGATDIVVTAGNVYVASNSAGIAVFDRRADGTLQARSGKEACLSFDGSDEGAANACTDVRGLGTSRFGGPFALRLSPDGKNLYAGTSTGAVLTLDLLASGALTQRAGPAGCARDDGDDDCFNATGLGGIVRQLAISPDGRSVYVPSPTRSGIVVFDRDAAGTLTQRSDVARCVTSNGFPVSGQDQCGKEPRLSGGGSAVLLSADGRFLYAPVADSVLTFARRADGSLQFASCINDRGDDGCTAGNGMSSLAFLDISPDGEDIAVENLFVPNALVFLHRNAADGRLSQDAGINACLTTNGSTLDNGAVVNGSCRSNASINAAGAVTFASNDLLYAASPFSSTVVAIKRDFAPRCADQSLAVGFESALAVPLSCTDRNGDALTLSIAGQPNAGQLGAIDTAGARVFYNPFGGFTGADAFKYRAFAGGQTSNTATVSLNVAAAPPAPGPGGLDADRDGFFAGQDCNDASAAIRPGALEVRGNRIDENCDGLAEPFPTVTSGVSAKWDINGARFKLTQLTISNPPKGAKLEFRCAGKSCPLKSKKLSGKVRSGLLNARSSLGKKLRYRAGQTIEVRIAATGFNTKVAQIKLRAGKTPSVVALCLAPGASKPQKTCA